MEVEALGYIGLAVADVNAWASFAEKELGLMAVTQPEGHVELRADDYAWRIQVSEGAADDIAFAGWEVSDEAALNALALRLAENGVDVTVGGKTLCEDRRVAGLIQFKDPEGLQLEAFYGPLQLTHKPFVSPHGVQFKTGDQGLGHIVLACEDKEAQMAFYADLLGLKLSDHINTEVVPGRPLSISFYRCNGRHHSLALAPVPIPKKLVHFMLETTSIDQVGRAMYRVLENDRHLSFTLGRHSNDEMLSFYVMTPSGFDLEFGWGGLTVEDESWHVKTHNVNSAWGHKFQRPPRRERTA